MVGGTEDSSRLDMLKAIGRKKACLQNGQADARLKRSYWDYLRRDRRQTLQTATRGVENAPNLLLRPHSVHSLFPRTIGFGVACSFGSIPKFRT